MKLKLKTRLREVTTVEQFLYDHDDDSKHGVETWTCVFDIKELCIDFYYSVK